MSTQTKTYGFVKPEITDPSDITSLNVNWDKVEAELENISTVVEHNDEEVRGVLDTMQSKITYGTGAPTGGNPGDIYIQLLDK